MIDLKNPHIVPLEYMSDEHIGAIIRAHSHGADVEFADGTNWHPTAIPQWRLTTAYRLAPVKDTIDWAHADPEWSGMARDSSGCVYLFPKEPLLAGRAWDGAGWKNITGVFSSYKRGTCEWQESWVPNPLHNK